MQNNGTDGCAMPSPTLKKAQGAIIVYEDEASFRQTPTPRQTWAPSGSQPQIPTHGRRNTQKILGAASLYDGAFTYRRRAETFNAETYMDFLETVLLSTLTKRGRHVYLIQDNASYHKKPEAHERFSANRKKLEVFLLGPHSPELNAIERLWHRARMEATHNRTFNTGGIMQ